MKHLKLLFLMVLACACTRPMPGPGPVPGQVDAGQDEAKRPCLIVCRKQSQLQCPAAQPTPEGHSCTVVCENLTSSGIATYDFACVKRAQICADIDNCASAVR